MTFMQFVERNEERQRQNQDFWRRYEDEDIDHMSDIEEPELPRLSKLILAQTIFQFTFAIVLFFAVAYKTKFEDPVIRFTDLSTN